MSNKSISVVWGCPRNSISGWIKICRSGGVSLLCSTHYCCPASEPEHHKQVIFESLNLSPAQSISEATVRIKQVAGIERKPAQVREFLLKHGCQFRKTGQIPGNADADKQERWVDALQPYTQKARKGECHLLFSDAAHFTLSAFVCMVWSVSRVFLKTASGRNRINGLGAVDALSKEVITHINMTFITAETLVAFLKQLRIHYREKPIVTVMDNAPYQHCQPVLDTAKGLNIEILFLPPYSPSLNIIERLWKFTEKKVLYGKFYGNPDLFHKTVRTFFNRSTKIIIWNWRLY